MSNSAENAYTVAVNPDASLVDVLAAEKQTIAEPIKKDVGSTLAIRDGRDYTAVNVRVVNSTFSAAEDHEKAVHINQTKGTGISVSLNTLKRIVEWAERQQQ